MPSIESILSKYDPSSSPEEPQSAEPSPKAAPSSIDSILSKYESSAPAAQEKPQLHTPNPFVSTAKSTAASMANAFAGQPLEDIGETIGSETLQKAGKGVREFAEGVQKENPSQIGSLSDIVDKPLTAVETALGNVAPQIPVSLAGGYAGAKLGGSLPLPLPAKAVAAGVGGILGAFAPNYLQEAAEMRGKQQESGVEDKTKAYLTAIPAAGLETASDVLLAGKFLPKAVKDTAIGKALTGLGDDTLSATGSRAAHVGKQALKGAGTEAGTEYAQTILEQLGGNQDTSTEEAQAEREVSAALGAIGGGAIRGGISAFDKRAGEVPPPATDEQAATQEPDFAEVPDTQPQEPIIAGAPSDLDLRTDEEKAAEQASELDLGIPAEEATPAVDTKKTEDFLNRFENAWASTGKEPTRVTKALADEATKLGVPVTPNDAPMAVVAAMRAEIQARKTPEEVAQDVGDTIVAETLAAYPDGKPGIAGKTVIAGASSKVLEPQKVAAEQKVAEQQPFVEEPIDEQALQDEAAAYQAELDAIPGVSERPPLTPLTAEDLQNQRMMREAAAAELLHPVEDEDEDSERQAALQARYEANKAAAATATETPATQQPEIKNGESEDQTAQTTTQEVTEVTEEVTEAPEEVAEAPEEVTEAPEEKARKLLVSAVPNGDLSSLRGKQNTDNRAKLIEALTGQPIAKSAATNAKLVQEFYKAAGIDLNQSLAGQQKQFQDWATQAQQLEEAGITEEFPIDLQAHKEAAASRFNGHRVIPENRDAQKKAYVTVKDLNIGIENPAGTKRKEEWPELKDHYGFFTGVKGADGDYLDVFIQPKLSPEAIENIQKVYVVDQKNEDGSFDEHKVIIGPDNVEAAKDLYLENYEPGWQGLGAITEMPFDEFKARIESGANWDESVAYKESATKVEVKKPESTEQKKVISAVAKRFGIPAATVSDVVNSTSDELQNREDAPTYPAGLARIGKYGDLNERYVEFVKRFKPNELTTSEFEQGIKKHPSYAEYLALAKAGSKPPLISVSETYSGGMQSSNRRRTLVAQELNKSIDGWFSPINKETGDPLKYGDILRAVKETESETPKRTITEGGKKRKVDDLQAQIAQATEKEATSKIANEILAGFKEETDFANRAKQRGEFLDKHRNFAAFAQSLINNDFEKAVDDIYRNRLPKDKAAEIFEDAKTTGLLTDLTLDKVEQELGSEITVDEFINSGDSLAELGTKLGLSEDEVDDALILKSWPRPSTPYLDLMNEIRGVIEDAKAKIKKPATGSASAQKAYQTTIQKWNAALGTLDAAEREFENPFSAKVAASKFYKELPPILKNRFEKRFDGITTGDQARREKYRAESAVKSEALIEFAKSKPKAKEPVAEEKAEEIPEPKGWDKFSFTSSNGAKFTVRDATDLSGYGDWIKGRWGAKISDREMATVISMARSARSYTMTDNYSISFNLDEPKLLDGDLGQAGASQKKNGLWTGRVSLNAKYVKESLQSKEGIKELAHTIAHEFAHVWQNINFPDDKKYFNKKWADRPREQQADRVGDAAYKGIIDDLEGQGLLKPDAKFSRTETSEPLPELFESLGRVNKLSQLSDDQLQRIDEHPDAERIRYVQDNFLDLLSELDTNNKVQIKC